MPLKWILLNDLPDEIMLVVEHSSGVVYRNQVGGNVCWQAEVEGVLAPLDVAPAIKERIAVLRYPNGRQGITTEIADAIDAALASERATMFLKVDRSRLDESWEAWIYVMIDSPVSNVVDPYYPPGQAPPRTYFGPLFGFGQAKGVLTWISSD
jgi:hypothetical protein